VLGNPPRGALSYSELQSIYNFGMWIFRRPQDKLISRKDVDKQESDSTTAEITSTARPKTSGSGSAVAMRLPISCSLSNSSLLTDNGRYRNA
jgi:hypothetical protein